MTRVRTMMQKNIFFACDILHVRDISRSFYDSLVLDI